MSNYRLLSHRYPAKSVTFSSEPFLPDEPSSTRGLNPQINPKDAFLPLRLLIDVDSASSLRSSPKYKHPTPALTSQLKTAEKSGNGSLIVILKSSNGTHMPRTTSCDNFSSRTISHDFPTLNKTFVLLLSYLSPTFNHYQTPLFYGTSNKIRIGTAVREPGGMR